MVTWVAALGVDGHSVGAALAIAAQDRAGRHVGEVEGRAVGGEGEAVGDVRPSGSVR